MFKSILILGFGGFLGTILRYAVQVLMQKMVGSPFPTGTLLVNVIGCFSIGLLCGLGSRCAWWNMQWNLFAVVGFCGAFTTFSTFSLDSLTLLHAHKIVPFFLYFTASVGLGFLATIGGLWLTSK